MNCAIIKLFMLFIDVVLECELFGCELIEECRFPFVD